MYLLFSILNYANKHNYSYPDSFYQAKTTMLKAHANHVGEDLQEIVNKCWACAGSGFYHKDVTCYSCAGSGVYYTNYFLLDRYEKYGFTFHVPKEKTSKYGRTPTIKGKIKKDNATFLSELAALFIIALFNNESFRNILKNKFLFIYWKSRNWFKKYVIGSIEFALYPLFYQEKDLKCKDYIDNDLPF
jgi:hypothetical protein